MKTAATLRKIAALAFALGMCGLPAARGDTELRTYPLTAPDAEAMVEAVRLLAGPGGRVIHDRGSSRLFVLAAPDDHARIAALLKEADVPLRNVRVDVAIDDAGSSREAAAGATGAGEVAVTPRGTGWRARVTPFARAHSSRQTGSVQQSLVVRDGGEALIRVARQVPYEETLVEYGRRWGYIERRLVMREVGAALRIRPRIIGDGPLIALRITPELSGVTDDGTRSIQYARAATEVTVRDGEAFDLGGLSEEREFYSMFLVGVDSRGNQRQLTITATPRIMAP
ncbi:MAG: hypothetical protein FJ225_04860 [Lentisphaerae bacterium]|nr:hypothetical protein [Lentisphaerota bacterium]